MYWKVASILTWTKKEEPAAKRCDQKLAASWKKGHVGGGAPSSLQSDCPVSIVAERFDGRRETEALTAIPTVQFVTRLTTLVSYPDQSKMIMITARSDKIAAPSPQSELLSHRCTKCTNCTVPSTKFVFLAPRTRYRNREIKRLAVPRGFCAANEQADCVPEMAPRIHMR